MKSTSTIQIKRAYFFMLMLGTIIMTTDLIASGPMVPPLTLDEFVAMMDEENPERDDFAAGDISIYGEQEQLYVIPLIIALKNKNARIRWQAVFMLKGIKDPRAVEPLAISLKDEDDEVRYLAIEALAKTKDPRAIEPIISALRDEDVHVRYLAIEALAETKDSRAIEPIISMLKNEDVSMRRAAVHMLAGKEDPRVVELLVTVIKEENDWGIKERALDTLNEIKDAQTKEAIFADITKAVITAMKDNSSDEHHKYLSEHAHRILSKIKTPEATKALIECFKKNSRRADVIRELGERKDPCANDILFAGLKDFWPEVRIASARALWKVGEIKDAQAAEHLLDLLKQLRDDKRKGEHYKNKNAVEILTICNVLGEIKDPGAVEPLAALIKEEKEWNIKVAALNALKQIKDPRAIEPIISALKDEDGNVRFAAVNALAGKEDPRVVEPLAALIQGGKEWDFKRAALNALKQIKDPRVIEILLNSLEHKNLGHEDKAIIIDALAETNDPRAIEPLFSYAKAMIPILAGDPEMSFLTEFFQSTVINALLKIEKTRAMQLVYDMLKDKNYIRRTIAAEILGKIKDPQAIEPLMRALDLPIEDLHNSRHVIVEALGQIGGTEMFVMLLKHNDEIVRFSAACALGRTGDARAVEPLISALKSENTGIRKEEAVRILGEIKDPRAVEPLLALFHDENSKQKINPNDPYSTMWIPGIPLRSLIIDALRKIDDPRVAPILISVLNDDSWSIRMNAVVALGEKNDPNAVDPLIARTKDKNASIRAAAAMALATTRDTRAVKPLVALLEDKNWYVRGMAAETLGKIGSQDAIGLLKNILDDEYEFVRINATRALKQIEQEKN